MYEVKFKINGCWHRYCKSETREEAVSKLQELLLRNLGNAVMMSPIEENAE